jgi:hypothetical protein
MPPPLVARAFAFGRDTPAASEACFTRRAILGREGFLQMLVKVLQANAAIWEGVAKKDTAEIVLSE